MKRDAGRWRMGAARALGLAGLAATAALVPQRSALAQESAGARFSSFDVGIGAAMPERSDVGVSYGVGFDVANLPASGLAARFGFRFWSTTDESADVDIDDSVLELVLKAHVDRGAWRGYAGVGFGAHFVSARLVESPALQDERDGFAPGLQLLVGSELSLGRDDFLAAFVEGVGSVVSGVSHGIVHAGLRVRFDRLGGR